jgi:oligopeptidase A
MHMTTHINLNDLPKFSTIGPESVVPELERLLDGNRAAIDALPASGRTWSWETLVEPLDELDDRINKFWSPIGHLNAVVNSDALREAYNAGLPKLSEYGTEMGQNENLFQAYRSLAGSAGYADLGEAQKQVISHALRDFELSGIALPADKKARYKEIAQELSRLCSQFSDNVLDATQGWTRHIEDEALLNGIPETARTLARQEAEQRKLSGWVFTLDFPSYYAVMTYADDRELRREFYTAYATRASELGPNAGEWDNSAIMEQILALRHEEAQLLGYDNYAALSLATKMADSPKDVVDFLLGLSQRSLPVARRDLEELRGFAAERYAVETLESWDIGYYSEKLRLHDFSLSDEELRPYFPATRVVPGMFDVVRRLYGLDIKQREDVDVWHPDVQFYEIFDAQGELRGAFYLDLFARAKKRGGAWMDDCLVRRKLKDGSIQPPVAYLVCNFTPPAGSDPALLRHEEVLTLFHEFGHGLHHMLTRVDYPGVSGIRGVEWDAVELPSQFMENFCWEREALNVLSGHYLTGEALPDSLYRKMIAARNFQSGMQMVRQLEFSLFDFRIHQEYDPARGGRIYEILAEVREQTAVLKPPAFNRFPHGFSHIFAGGYAAGYYSYKWAEVLSSDAFSLFEERGVFDPETGREFMEKILERGGSRKAMELFKDFRGREPEIDALLRHSGIAA